MNNILKNQFRASISKLVNGYRSYAMKTEYFIEHYRPIIRLTEKIDFIETKCSMGVQIDSQYIYNEDHPEDLLKALKQKEAKCREDADNLKKARLDLIKKIKDDDMRKQMLRDYNLGELV